MSRGTWPVIGLVVGAIAGALWGLSSGEEAIDSAVGTAFLCGLAGLLLGALAYTLAGRR